MDENRTHLDTSIAGNADNIDRLLGMLYLTGKKYKKISSVNARGER